MSSFLWTWAEALRHPIYLILLQGVGELLVKREAAFDSVSPLQASHLGELVKPLYCTLSDTLPHHIIHTRS